MRVFSLFVCRNHRVYVKRKALFGSTSLTTLMPVLLLSYSQSMSCLHAASLVAQLNVLDVLVYGVRSWVGHSPRFQERLFEYLKQADLFRESSRL